MDRGLQGLEASKAIVGFLQYKGAEGLAPITVSDYERDLKTMDRAYGGYRCAQNHLQLSVTYRKVGIFSDLGMQ